MFLFMFVLADLCVLQIRSRVGLKLTYGYMMPLFPLLPIVATVVQLLLAVLVVRISWIAWAITGTWVVCGLVLFFLYSNARALPIPEEMLTSGEAPRRGG